MGLRWKSFAPIISLHRSDAAVSTLRKHSRPWPKSNPPRKSDGRRRIARRAFDRDENVQEDSGLAFSQLHIWPGNGALQLLRLPSS